MKSTKQPINCIFCLKTKPASEEHVFPKAIGGHLSIFCVCQDCNSWLGGKIDHHLVSFPTIQLRRAQLKLAGKRGSIPHGFEMLEGRSYVIDEKGDRHTAWTTFDKVSKKPVTKLEPLVTKKVNDHGQVEVEVSGDPNDAHILLMRLQGERKRAGLSPLSPEEISKDLKLTDEETFNSPLVSRKIEIDIFGFHLALAKIAYELAFRWFGSEFHGDPIAAKIRKAIVEQRAEELLTDIALLDQDDVATITEMWQRDGSHHLAFATYQYGHTTIFIRIFDVIAVAVRVSESNLLAPSKGIKDSFVAISSQTGHVHEAPHEAEFQRLRRGVTSTDLKLPK